MQVVLETLFILLILAMTCTGANDLEVSIPKVVVWKCCSEDEMLDERFNCQSIHFMPIPPWLPKFYDDFGRPSSQTQDYHLEYGLPNCGNHQQRHVYEYENSTDRLFLRPDGVLRHYTQFHEDPDDEFDFSEPMVSALGANYYDHSPGTFCLDMAVLAGGAGAQTAVVCVPAVSAIWDVDFLIRRVIDPFLHCLAIACLLAVAVVYFVLPSLRDLVGNIISTIAICLIISQIADLVRIFTEFRSHISFIVADVIMYLSLMAAFFWLSSLGYYIWRTFRTRNVFLRVSDGRKYCYYSCYAWGCTLVMTVMALVAHFLFDTKSGLPFSPHDQETIGWLGIAVFFSPIAFTILVDVYFYVATARAISRMATYGRIHGRMKFSFQLFIQLFLVMSTAWLFLLLSWLQYDAVIFANIIVNALQAPLILIICVLGRKSVRSQISKTCCQGNADLQWGEEMMSMTSN